MEIVKRSDKRKKPEGKGDKRDLEMEQSLRTIYATEDGLPDMSKLDSIKSKRWIIAAIGIPVFIIMLCVAAWTGFLYFRSFDGFAGKDLVLTVEGPGQIALGEETTYFINYFNPLREPVTDVEVRANFPTDFVLTSSNPPLADGLRLWKIGPLAAEQKGTITIKGRFTGALGTLSAIQAIATYKPLNRSRNLEALATSQVTYSDTILEGSIVVPEKAIPGEEMRLAYQLKNKGSEPLHDLKILMSLPDGFTPKNASTSKMSIEGAEAVGKLAVFEAGSSTEFVVVGTFASGSGGQAKVISKAGSVGKDGVFMPAQISEATLPVLAGDLNLKLVVNGSDNAERSIAYGDSLQCALGFENNADEPLKKVTLRLVLESVNLLDVYTPQKQVLVDWEKLKNASTTIKDNALIWDAANTPELKEIAERGTGSMEISVPLVSNATGTGIMAVKAMAYADIEEIGDLKIKRTIQMAPMYFKFRSDAKVNSEIRYYSEEGAPLGSGPLPPKIGEATRYRVLWSLDKSIHSLKDLEISSVLPTNVNYVSMATTTAGQMTFEPKTRVVSWKLNRLPTGVNSAQIEFDIEIKPSLADDGRFAELLGQTTFQAFDEDIKENLLQVIKPMNTDLQNDEGAKGKGVIRK